MNEWSLDILAVMGAGVAVIAGGSLLATAAVEAWEDLEVRWLKTRRRLEDERALAQYKILAPGSEQELAAAEDQAYAATVRHKAKEEYERSAAGFKK